MGKSKEKPKSMPDRSKPLIKFLLYGILVFGLGLALREIMPVHLRGDGQIHRTSLPDELLPTAQALQNNPPLDEIIVLNDDVSMRINLDGWGDDTICFDAHLIPAGTGYVQHSRIFVNGKRVYGAMNSYLLLGISGLDWMNLCIYGRTRLEPGLHLLEFHLRNSPFGKPIAIQQWAIEIE